MQMPKNSSLSDQLPVIQKIDLKNGPIAVKDNNMPQAKFNSLTVRFCCTRLVT